MINCLDDGRNTLVRLSSALVGVVLLVVILYPNSMNAYIIDTQSEGSFAILIVMLAILFSLSSFWVYLKFGRNNLTV